MHPETIAGIIFLITYLGIAAGNIPGLAIDRTGIALLGAIAMLVSGSLTESEAIRAIDTPTILLIYSLMVLSAQFTLAGFYTRIALGIVRYMKRPPVFLLALMCTSAFVSALLANDIVCLTFTPVICASLLSASLNPVPFLIGLACASNIGSAATIIGNPQNMLIGQVAGLHFGRFALWCTPPTVLSLAASYAIILGLYRGKWKAGPPVLPEMREGWPAYDAHEVKKTVFFTVLLIVFFFTGIPRELTAICIAGILLCSRKIPTRSILGLVDWHLITLFCALFIVVQGVAKFGLPQRAFLELTSLGIDINRPCVLSPVTLLLSNLLSNVPAVMLLIRNIDLDKTTNLYLLALVSTFAGNLITIGSIANMITLEQAKRFNVFIGFRTHAKVGIPVAVVSVLIAMAWGALFG